MNRLQSPRYAQQRGFTLVELIIVIVLLAILSIASFRFIGFGAQIFSDAADRYRLVAEQRFAITRLELELLNAVPRSVRVLAADNARCLEWVPMIASNNYLRLPKPGGPGGGVEFTGILPLTGTSGWVGKQLYVYANEPQYVYGNANTRRKTISSTTENDPQTGLFTAEFNTPPPVFETESPASRFYIGDQPVSWCVDETAQTLIRFADYGRFANQRTLAQLKASSAAREVMASGIGNDILLGDAPFEVFAATLLRNSLVKINLHIISSELNDPLVLNHEVHIPNVP